MIRQRVLLYKIEMTRDTITPHAGLALLVEFTVGLGMLEAVDKYLPKPGSGAGYKGFKGYMPMVGHLAENGLVLGDEFREGNASPESRNLDFLKYCVRQMPKGKKIKGFRSDSAAYQAEIIIFWMW